MSQLAHFEGALLHGFGQALVTERQVLRRNRHQLHRERKHHEND